MRKISSSYKAERRTVLMASFVISFIPILIFQSLDHYVYHWIPFKELNLIGTLGVVLLLHFILILLSFVLYSVALKRGYDIRLEKYFAARVEKKNRDFYNKILEKEQLNKKNISRFQNEAYKILSVQNTGLLYVYKIVLSNSYVKEAPPKITVNGSERPIKMLSDTEFSVGLGDLIVGRLDDIVFVSGKHSFVIKNPYKMSCPEKHNIKWQCEGGSDERIVYVPASYFPNIDHNIPYPFEILINSRLIGSFHGKYCSENDTILIPIGKSVSKNDTINKTCVLRYSIGSTVKIVLPEPVVLLRNSKPV